MIYAFDEYEFDADGVELRKAGRVVKAEALVLRLLGVLLRDAGRLVSKDELVAELWEGRPVADNVVTVAVARLRKTLGARRGERELVTSVYGRGYRFVRPVTIRSVPAPLSEAPPREEGGGDPLFVGRERVMQRLRLAFDRACEGRGQLCVILGEPGIGKTRVVEALERELPGDRARVVWGFCREAGDTPPLWPFLPVLRELLSDATFAASNDGALLRGVLNTFGMRDPQREAEGAQAVTESATRHHTFDAIARALRAASSARPWLIVLDDLHRADAASRELLSLLVDEIARTRLLIVSTLRPAQGKSGRAEGFLSHVLGHRNCERILLERLRPDEVAAYVAALVDDPEGRLGAAVYERCEGNPFYMTEVARQLSHSEDPESVALSVPGAALDLIRQRVALLDESCRDVLTTAAVIGRSFELSLLQLVTEREVSDLMRSLDEAIEADLVVAASESATAFAFGHDLMRSVLYDAIPPADRRMLHVRVADALESRAASNAVPPSELAYHLHAALPVSDPRKTVHYCRLAAAACAAAWAHAEAARYHLKALSALNLLEHPSARLRLSLWYAITIYGRGDGSADFLRSIDELTRLAREQRDGPMLVRAAIARSQHPELAPLPGARAALEEGLALLTDDAEGWRGVGLTALACLPPNCYDAARTEALLDEGLPRARAASSRAALFAALVARLHALGGPQHAEENEALARELEALGRQNPDRNQLLPLYLAQYRAFAALQRGDVAGLNLQLQRALTRAREVRYGQQLFHLERCRALVQLSGDAPADALTTLEALHRRGEQRCIGGAALFTAFDRAVVLPEFGAPLPQLDAATAAALALDSEERPHIWAIKVRALAELRAQGASDLAHAALRQRQPEELAALPCDSQYLGTLGQLARAALALDASEYYRPLHALLARFSAHYAANVAMFSEGAVPGLMGMLSLALGERARALAELQSGLQMNERSGLALRAIELRLLLAACGERGAPSQRARLALARESQQLATRLGLRRLAHWAAALIDAPLTPDAVEP